MLLCAFFTNICNKVIINKHSPTYEKLSYLNEDKLVKESLKHLSNSFVSRDSDDLAENGEFGLAGIQITEPSTNFLNGLITAELAPRAA